MAAKVAHTVRAYEHDPRSRDDAGGYGQEAAAALGIDPAMVFKTLIVDVDSSPVVVCCPVASKVDLKAVAAAVGGKRATMADPVAAQRITGYVMGGISPIGQKRRLPTVIDASAAEHATVLVSAGRRGLDVELSPADLVTITAASLAPIAAG